MGMLFVSQVRSLPSLLSSVPLHREREKEARLARILVHKKLCTQVSGFAPMEMGAATARQKPGTRYCMQQDIMVKLALASQPFEALETKKGEKTNCR
jgi:hypothetical protein